MITINIPRIYGHWLAIILRLPDPSQPHNHETCISLPWIKGEKTTTYVLAWCSSVQPAASSSLCHPPLSLRYHINPFQFVILNSINLFDCLNIHQSICLFVCDLCGKDICDMCILVWPCRCTEAVHCIVTSFISRNRAEGIKLRLLLMLHGWYIYIYFADQF